ncbi:MAG TPA: sensor domain-containing protein, partial [Solirubrobacteraceae bacterium]
LAVRALAYLAFNLPLGILGVVALAVLMAGAVLSLVWIGLPILLAGFAVVRRLADLDRSQANRLLDAHLGPLAHRPARGDTAGRRVLDTLSDRETWRLVALLALKLPLTVVLLVVAVAPIGLTAALLVLGVEGIGGLGDTSYVGPVALDVPVGVALCLLAVPTAVVAIALLGALRTVLRVPLRALLAPRAPESGPVREMLAESLGDRTLSIAYWLPDRGTFVDESGRQVELPERGSGRAWTAVEGPRGRVAAIIHDAALDTGPELVQAAAAAAALALDNERLKADLRARVEELRVSRVRIVEAADSARRRLERDLHDGAQQQLVALALDLRLLKARVRDTEVEPLVDDLAEKLSVALADLRELARGIHPAILTDRGLGPAVEALAARAGVAVETDVKVDERLPPAVEAGAYFVVAEALTNVDKYARTDAARVAIARDGDDIVVVVADDGVGGVSLRSGSGLRGLNDRIAALEGTLTVDSPPGRGTRVRARIPCTAGTLATEVRDDQPAPGAGPAPGAPAEPVEPRA